MSVVIDVDNISKLYRLGKIGTGTLSHDLKRWWAEARGQEDPYAKVASVNDRTETAAKGEYVWALRDISFKISQGDVVGVIGKNGAGKSTLLKILSRITAPTTGAVKIKGRIGSLLEVGTGFHPEMTGRENIFMNGTVLGMRKYEITRKFDEIVDFAGVAKYIDTPVKRYSSGMMVRLGFAVAAHLEPEILIVDEVLAVGDAEFQKKALGKMQDVSKNQGRTVLFVSHNMLAVKSLCKAGILMDKGKIETTGKIEDVIYTYMSAEKLKIASFIEIEKVFKGFTVHSVAVSNNGINGTFNIEEELVFEIKVSSGQDHETININLFFKATDDAVIFATCSNAENFTRGAYVFKCSIPANTLNDIVYTIDMMVVEKGPNILHHLKDIVSIEGVEEKREGWLGKFPGVIRPMYYPWTKSKIDELV